MCPKKISKLKCKIHAPFRGLSPQTHSLSYFPAYYPEFLWRRHFQGGANRYDTFRARRQRGHRMSVPAGIREKALQAAF